MKCAAQEHASLIFLIGSRCSGKSTTARLLAERLGWNWLDSDLVLEERLGQSIREIFERDGEAAFRQKEAALLVELSQLRRHVIAMGGGVVLSEANRTRLQSAGWTVWLTADPATLWERLQSDPTTKERRPTLTVGGIEELEQTLAARERHYRDCARLTVSTAGRSPQAVVDEILVHLPGRAGP